LLLPQQLLWFSKSEEFDKAEQHHLNDCIECGACAYVCPSNIPLVQYYRYAKGAIAELTAEAEKAERARERFEHRKQRIEQEEAEKEARRIAKAEEAAARAAAKTTENTSTTAVVDSKALTIAAALARSSLKKAEKRLLVAQASEENTDDLVAEIERLKIAVSHAEAALQLAQSITPPSSEKT